MISGNWLIWPERDHIENNDLLNQYPITLEHLTRGVCLKIFEPPMLDLLKMIG